MRTKPKVVVLSGGSGCGKTTLCTRVIALARAQGFELGGILTPPRLDQGLKVGLDVEDVRTGQRRPLAELIGITDGPATGRWRFHAGALAWGTSVLRSATPCDLLIIDELGPLELIRGQGWTIALDVLKTGAYRLALVNVRPALLSRFQEQLEEVESLTMAVTRANRDALPGQILDLLGTAQ